jgi:hypothetical protein
MNWKRTPPLSLGLVLVFFFPSSAAGQAADSSTPSLGDVARTSKKAGGPKAKALVTNENLKSQSAAIPAIAMEDVDNSDEIIRAIRGYRKTHSDVQTEEAVRQWYDEFDSLMASILDDNARLIQRKEDRNLTEATGAYYGPDGDYYKAVQRRNSAIAEDREDFRRRRKNGFTVARIQQTFMRVRSDLQSCNLRYDWFKIRNANGNGSY